MYDCTFEIKKHPFCSWTHDEKADFKFTQKSGSTPSSGTGPKGDSTSGSGTSLLSRFN